MRILVLAAIVSILPGTLQAQPFGNEWIDYSRRYYRIPIAQDGVYRITFNDLANAGIPISGINPQHLLMWANGQPVPIYVEGEGDGIFNIGDYIEFVGLRNRGFRETVLYPNAEAHANDDYSLYNDTLHYFLTWATTGGHARITTETDQNFGAYTPAPFVWRHSPVVFSSNYYPGQLDAFGVSLPYYTEGEGWMSARFGFPQGSILLDTQVPTTRVYRGPGAPPGEAYSVSAGASNASAGGGNNHHLQIRFGTANTLAVNHQFAGYKVNRFNFDIPNAALVEGTTRIRHEVSNSMGVASDYQAVAKTGITYPHETNLGGVSEFRFLYRLNPNQNKTRFDLSGITGTSPVLYTTSNPARRVLLSPNGDAYRVLVPNSFNDPEYECFIVTNATIKPIPSIKPAGNNGFFTHFAQAPVDSAYIIIAHQSLLPAGVAYANYRQQRFGTVLVNVDELYDQFGWGVPKSGLGLRNFANFLLANWNAPQYLLLLGKSVREAREGNVAGARQNASFYAQNLVPSLGYPSSDVYITSGLAGTTLQPAIPTGRISARNLNEALWYLQKVQTFEGQPHAAWMKNILHFGGGGNATEQQNFAFYLNSYAQIIQDTAFGGSVHTFLKDDSAPIQINVSQNITQLIESGTSLLTFFGHASSDGFDQSIDNPQNFNWNGRYPLLIGNSCFTGDFHAPGQASTSERYTLLQNQGVIGFLASTKLGFEPYLNIYSSRYYKHLSLLNYGSTIGDHMRKTVRDIQFSLGPTPNMFMINTCLGFNLQGDPAIVLNSWPFPDLALEEQGVFFTPAEITADVDTFQVHVALTNSGKGTLQPFGVTVEHTAPNGEQAVYTAPVPGLLYRDTISFKVPLNPQTGLGLHSFNVLVDLPDNQIQEMPGYEVVNNQVLNKQLLVSNGGIVPVYPYRYAVVPQPNVTLKASTGNPLEPTATYRLEIDTTDVYNSPMLLTTEITQTGGVVSWTPPVSYPDSVVYFWRAKQLTGNGDDLWRESSFQYIPKKTGWGQANFYQFKNNNYFQTEYNRPEGRIDFFTGTARLTNTVYGNSASNGNEVLLNTSILEYGACFTIPSIHMVVIDPVTLKPWGTNFGGQNPQNDFGNANANGGCRQRVENYFIFRQNIPAQMEALANVLNSNTIPDGHYVLLYTMRFVSYNNWEATPSIYPAFKSLGAQMIGSPAAQDTVPFSFLCRKGDPTFVYELYGTSLTDTLVNVIDLPASGNLGSTTSQRIGPAQQWKQASWQFRSLDAQPGDSALVRIIGISPTGAEQPLFNAQYDPFSTVEVNLEGVADAAQYPMLRLEARLSDPVFTTPPQIDRWHILHEPVADAALSPHDHFVFKAPELNEGETGYLSVAIRNVSDVPMDSLLVHYWIEDQARNRIALPYPRQDSLRANAVLIDTVYFHTRHLGGTNAIWVEVNPRNALTGNYDQPEQVRFNNLMRVPFKVNTDRTNPMLDVTFDGVHIMNGDIISPRPEVLISLKDENPFLLLNEPADTAFFKVFLKMPSGGDFRRVFFSTSSAPDQMIFVPAADARNKAKILYRPNLPEDGKYSLLVQATDKSGNASGNFDYRIEFEVIHRATISEVLNYPNPFTTSTQFVFTLTGSEIPDEFKIQIMTVSGRVVREITQAEFGPIRIGRNLSVYRWDGRDEFGDRLANGVYLYRAIARLNGKEIELSDNGASQYFTKGFGKMVLMR